MTFKEIVYKYGRDGSTDVMEKLTEKVSWFTEKVKEKDPDLASHFLTKVDMLLNPHFTKESAQIAVSQMKNKDGTTGEHWNYDTTSSVLSSIKKDYDPADWYYVLNMMYSDYYKPDFSDQHYIDLAEMFISDEDAPHDKAKRYYLAMHC